MQYVLVDGNYPDEHVFIFIWNKKADMTDVNYNKVSEDIINLLKKARMY